MSLVTNQASACPEFGHGEGRLPPPATMPPRTRRSAPDSFKVHILDVGEEKYGDCTFLDFGEVTVLIDGAHSSNIRASGGHPSIPEQLQTLRGGSVPPHDLTVLVVTHAHLDHIGCLPALVRDEVIRPRWALVADPLLGWGLTANDATSDTDSPSAALVAALREEPRPEEEDDELEEFLADAVTLRQRYTEMVQTLVDRGTNVIRYGVDPVEPLMAELRRTGVRMDILGPSEEHLLFAAEAIAQIGRDSADSVVAWRGTLPPGHDGPAADVALYRQILAGADSVDVRSTGSAINNQSLVLRFECLGRKLLFPGDMQFAKPEVVGLEELMRQLRNEVIAGGPYDLFRLPHHGSYNAFDTALCDALEGTTLFAISTGAGSLSHPNPRVLRLFDERRNELDWVRTDRNGLVTIEFRRSGDASVQLTRGELDDARPNGADPGVRRSEPVRALPPPPSTRAPAPPAPVVVESVPLVGSDVVELRARVPHIATRVTITIDVEPRSPSGSAPSPPRGPSDHIRDRLPLAGGRTLPRLVFLTDRERLAANVGTAEAEAALDLIRHAGHPLLEHLPERVDAARAAEVVRQAVRSAGGIRGVVLLGGYDVVPSQRLDVLDPGLRARVAGGNDPDDFLVWSDDGYGCTDGDGIPELPVSRIPDGKSGELLLAALSAGSTPPVGTRRGVRNVRRPFADRVFSEIPGVGDMISSEPHAYSADPPVDLTCDHLYLMLHGDSRDATRFWGEGVPGDEEAINLATLPSKFYGTAFAGCCWGGLPAVARAVDASPGTGVGGRTPDESIALALLKAGARAFVGCTGAHYSPLEPPYRYFGGPMHEAFWRRLAAGEAPAEALFGAKIEYIEGMPHGRRSAISHAIEHKTLWQYTCLGLGW